MKTLLRPSDIAWQAFQAGIAYARSAEHQSHRMLGDQMKLLNAANREFNTWWAKHPQTTIAGELKLERRQRKAKP